MSAGVSWMLRTRGTSVVVTKLFLIVMESESKKGQFQVGSMVSLGPMCLPTGQILQQD